MAPPMTRPTSVALSSVLASDDGPTATTGVEVDDRSMPTTHPAEALTSSSAASSTPATSGVDVDYKDADLSPTSHPGVALTSSSAAPSTPANGVEVHDNDADRSRPLDRIVRPRLYMPTTEFTLEMATPDANRSPTVPDANRLRTTPPPVQPPPFPPPGWYIIGGYN